MSFEELEHDDPFYDEDEGEIVDWQLPLCFMKKRHKELIEGSRPLAQTWRMKERMKTVSVALVLCLNIGVDPPDVVKTSPCARMECWIDAPCQTRFEIVLIIQVPIRCCPHKDIFLAILMLENAVSVKEEMIINC
ncbi:regulatory-associated protein of mTOR-like [Montipora capricornis]|uniref:regulatory-associated protein of mTOR-like n=1 Tax=Montipora capricornis TaxID=246305 RepID=UPI0035F1DD1F